MLFFALTGADDDYAKQQQNTEQKDRDKASETKTKQNDRYAYTTHT
jgi:hypothetical protein